MTMSRQQYIEGLYIVDANNRAYSAYHAYKRLSFRGKSVSVIYGMPAMLKGLLWDNSPGKVIVVWDGKRAKQRTDMYPDYKKGRNKDLTFDYEQFDFQRRVVRKMLFYLGVPQVLNPQAEADDLIAKIARIAQNKYKTVRIQSTDKDFHQVLNEKIWVLNDRLNNWVTPTNCKELFGYTPSETVDYLILVGDDSDQIKGYPGMGPVKTRLFLDKYGTIEDFLDSGESFSPIKRSLLLEIKKRNEFLIDLKLFYSLNKESLKTVFYRDESNPGMQIKKFKKLCHKFGIQKFLASGFLDEFIELKERQE